jgi:ribosome maturation factor RimP
LQIAELGIYLPHLLIDAAFAADWNWSGRVAKLLALGMVQHREIETLIAPIADQLGYELVRVRLSGGSRLTLQVMAERRDRRSMKVEDCARLSREISPALDAADPIEAEYVLEVSSPGIDRPLIRPADYARFVGHEARIELDAPVEGRKRLQGLIGDVSEGAVTLMLDDAPLAIPFAAVKRAKLVLTERLIAAARDEEQAAESAPDIHANHEFHA